MNLHAIQHSPEWDQSGCWRKQTCLWIEVDIDGISLTESWTSRCIWCCLYNIVCRLTNVNLCTWIITSCSKACMLVYHGMLHGLRSWPWPWWMMLSLEKEVIPTIVTVVNWASHGSSTSLKLAGSKYRVDFSEDWPMFLFKLDVYTKYKTVV